MPVRKIGLDPERYNGLIYKKEKTTPRTTMPLLLDSILEQVGIQKISNKKLQELAKEEGFDLD